MDEQTLINNLIQTDLNLQLSKKVDGKKIILNISKQNPKSSSDNIKKVLHKLIKKELILICSEFNIEFAKSWSNDKFINSIKDFFEIYDEIPETNINEAAVEAPYTFIDLFCGIGSFHYSFDKLGMKCVMVVQLLMNNMKKV